MKHNEKMSHEKWKALKVCFAAPSWNPRVLYNGLSFAQSLNHPSSHSFVQLVLHNLNLRMKAAAVTRTHLGGPGAASGPSSRHICCTRWSTAAGRRPPAPTPGRWSAPPCSRRTVALSPLGIQPVKLGSGVLRQRSNSGRRGGDWASWTERRHPAIGGKWRRSRDAGVRELPWSNVEVREGSA